MDGFPGPVSAVSHLVWVECVLNPLTSSATSLYPFQCDPFQPPLFRRPNTRWARGPDSRP